MEKNIGKSLLVFKKKISLENHKISNFTYSWAGRFLAVFNWKFN